jgi:hypothetical protein
MSEFVHVLEQSGGELLVGMDKVLDILLTGALFKGRGDG